MINIRLTLTLLLLIAWNLISAQKFTPFGIDSAMNHLKGSLHFETTLEHYTSEQNDKPITITQFNTTLTKYLFNRVGLSGNLFFSIPRGERFINFEGNNANTFGSGLSGGIKIDVLNFTHHNLYVETLYGMIFTLDEFPPGGTHWNFMVRYGIGYNVLLNEGRYLFLGWRWMHISNGTGLVPGNPAYDGNGIFLGFKFSK